MKSEKSERNIIKVNGGTVAESRLVFNCCNEREFRLISLLLAAFAQYALITEYLLNANGIAERKKKRGEAQLIGITEELIKYESCVIITTDARILTSKIASIPANPLVTLKSAFNRNRRSSFGVLLSNFEDPNFHLKRFEWYKIDDR